jgi:secondary thiamine-phosphate synthase enzyme
MRQFVDILSISTRGRGLVEITREVLNWLEPHAVQAGLLTLFCRHTSAGLVIQENAARDVRTDLETFFDRVAPEDGGYWHTEGADDMPAHIRTVLTGVQLAVPILPWRARFGDMARDLSVRASPRAASARDRLASHWRMTPAAQITDRKRGWASQFSLIYATRTR